MSKVRGISREPPLVRVMEQEHGKMQTKLNAFLRSSIYKTIIFTILPIIPGIFMKDWSMIVILPVVSLIYYSYMIRKTLKSISLARVGNILFSQTNIGSMINIEDVYNTTLQICEMKGVINGINNAVNAYSVCETIIIITNIISHLLTHLIGGQ